MDEGLRAYMLKVYNFMASGVLLTGIIALNNLLFVLLKQTLAGAITVDFTSTW